MLSPHHFFDFFIIFIDTANYQFFFILTLSEIIFSMLLNFFDYSTAGGFRVKLLVESILQLCRLQLWNYADWSSLGLPKHNSVGAMTGCCFHR